MEVVIIKEKITYGELIGMFGTEFEMPPLGDYMKGDEIEYRCPYHSKCPANANCFAIGTPKVLHEDDVLNIKCRLCDDKIPVYARLAANRILN